MNFSLVASLVLLGVKVSGVPSTISYTVASQTGGCPSRYWRKLV
jgi:hypothetical protein